MEFCLVAIKLLALFCSLKEVPQDEFKIICTWLAPCTTEHLLQRNLSGHYQEFKTLKHSVVSVVCVCIVWLGLCTE